MRLIDALDARVDGRPVAAARMLLAFALAICVLESAAVLRGIADGKLRIPVAAAFPAPTDAAVQIYLIAGIAAAALLAFCLLANAAAALGSLLMATALLWDQQTYSSHHLLVTLLLAYLAFASSGARWSIAARIKRGTSQVPWWPQLLMMTQVSVVYLFAGLSKVNPIFLSGEPLQAWMWIALPLWSFQALAVATIAIELFLSIALWIPRLRILAVVVGLGLHLGIVVGLTDQTLVLTAFAAASVSVYGMFLNRPALQFSANSTPGRVALRTSASP